MPKLSTYKPDSTTGSLAPFTPVFNVKGYGALGDGTTDDSTAVASAITAATTNGGIVHFPAGTYLINTMQTLASNVHVRGAGMGTTILKSGATFSYVLGKLGTGGISDFSVQDLTINVNNVGSGSAMRFEYATRGLIRNVRMQNVPSGGFNLVFGVTSGADATIRNSDIRVENCHFDTLASTYEHILVFNTQRIVIRDCDFYNTTAYGHGIGIYQNVENILISGNTFRAITGLAIYYSISTNHIAITNNSFLGGGSGIKGANEADNGLFSFTKVRDLRVVGNYFTACNPALQIGAVDSAEILNNHFDTNVDNTIIIDDGNMTVGAQSSNWRIMGNTFRNNNSANNSHSIHTAVQFFSIGGSHYGIISSNNFYDDQGTKTQRYPIGFDGAFTWDYITITNNRLTADTGNSGTSVVLADSAALGSNVKIYNNQDYSGTSPAQTTLGDVAGPASATDNGIPRYDTTTGKLLQDSAWSVDDTGYGTITSSSAAGFSLTKTGAGAGTAQVYNDGNLSFVGPGSYPSRKFSVYDQVGAGSADQVANPPFTNFSDLDTGMYFPAANAVAMTAAGAEVARFTSVGMTLATDDAYDATSWNGSLVVPTKNAIRDKIETLSGGGQTTVTKVVAASGGDYTTLGAAITAASAGWVIYVRAGTYVETTITSSLTNLTILGDGAENTVVGLNTTLTTLSGANVRISGIKFTMSTGGILLSGAASEFLDCRHTKSGSTAIGFKQTGTGSVCMGNSFETTAGHASNNSFVWITGNNIRVIGNYFTIVAGTAGAELIAFSSNYGTFNDNNITVPSGNNPAPTLLCNNASTGFMTITGNVISSIGTTCRGVLLNNPKMTFTGNTIEVAGSYGIQVYDTATISGNWINSTLNTAPAIELQGSAIGVTITGNSLKGATSSSIGIKINGDYDSTNITGNTINTFTTGINVQSSSADYTTITGNTFIACTTPIANSNETTSIIGNMGANITLERQVVRMKNNSGGSLAAGDVVILDTSVAAGDNVTTTTTAGSALVLGMAAEAISSAAFGMIVTKGKVVSLKADGTTDIAVGDFLGTFTTAKIVQKASAGQTAFAIALEAYATNDSSGVIDALLITPRLI